MTIILDEDKNIIQLIIVGQTTDKNAIEVDNIEQNIVKNIFDYKYIDGKFVLKESANIEKLKKIKQAKIKSMSNTCSSEIINGIEWNGEHYSLTLDDQTNISNLTMLASQGQSVPYHADGDGANCKIFTPEEFIQFSTYCQKFKIYQLTYFNQLKGYINSLQTIDDVLEIKYGINLEGDYATALSTMTGGFEYNNKIIEDNTDYSILITDIDIDSLYFPTSQQDQDNNTEENNLTEETSK